MKRLTTSYLCLFALLLFQFTASAQDSLNVTLLGSYNTPYWGGGGGGIMDACIVDEYAFIALFDGGLRVVDISDPANPIETGSYLFTGYALAEKVAISGNYAYVTAFFEGLRILDISDPSNPIEAGIYNIPGMTFRVAAYGNYAYISGRWENDDFTFRMIDVSDPVNPVSVWNYDAWGYPIDILVDNTGHGTFVHFMDFGNFYIADVTDPENPDVIGSCELLCVDGVGGCDVLGNYAYIANADSGLVIVDIADMTEPFVVSYAVTGGTASSVAVQDSLVYLLERDFGDYLYIYNLSDPENPVALGSFENQYGVNWDVEVSGDYAYLTSGERHFQIIDISDPHNPETVSSIHNGEKLTGIAVSGEFAFLTFDSLEASGFIKVLDMSNPPSPVEVGFFILSYPAYDICIDGEYAYVVSQGPRGGSFHVVDITEPEEPEQIDSVFLRGVADKMDLQGEYAFLATAYGLEIIDISNPEDAELIVSEQVNYSSNIAVSGNYAYLTHEDLNGGFIIYDISDPSDPEEIARYNCGPTTGIAFKDNYVYLAHWVFGFNGPPHCLISVFDVTDPDLPTLVDSMEYHGSHGHIEISGNYAMFSCFGAALKVINISNPLDIYECGFYDVGGNTEDVFILGHDVYLAHGERFFVFQSLYGGPAPVELIEPENKAVLEELNTTLRWTSSRGLEEEEIEYEVQLSQDADFDDPLIEEVGSDTSFVLEDLDDNTEYWWRVIAVDENEETNPSLQTWHFQTSTPQPPGYFDLLEPEYQAELSVEESYEIITRWEESIDPNPYDTVLYKIQFSVDFSNRDTILTYSDIPDTQFTFSLPESLGITHWEELSVTWLVDAISSSDTVRCDNRFEFTVEQNSVVFDPMFETVPTEFAISAVYPNPFNPAVQVVVAVPVASEVRAEIFDLLGREIATITSGQLQAGYHRFSWNAQEYPSGLYFLCVSSATGWNAVHKMMLLK